MIGASALAPPIAAVVVLAIGVRLGPGAGRPVRHRPPGRVRRWAPVGDRRVLGAAIALVVASVFAVGPLVTGSVAVGVGGASLGRHHLVRRRAAARVDGALPELVDLLRLAVGGGLPVVGALAAVAPRAPAPVAPAVAEALARLDRGLPLDDVLVDLARALGSGSEALVAALGRSAATGAALGPLLAPVAADQHERRRLRGGIGARLLPVGRLRCRRQVRVGQHNPAPQPRELPRQPPGARR